MTKRFAYLVAVASCILATTPAEAGKKPQVTGLALQQIQSRDYEVSKDVSFPAVMTVLQDSGYRISDADKDTGLITAAASTKSKTTWLPFVGFGKSKKTPVVSAFIEDRGAGSRIRLTFVMAKTKNQGYGFNWSDEEPITDPAVYRDAFEKIEKEIFVRQALSAPEPKTAPIPAAASSSPTPASSSNSIIPNPPNMPSALTPNPQQ